MISSQIAGLAGGLVAVIAVVLALFSVVLLLPVIVIVANRAEPDQRGLRPQSVYLFGMSFVTL
jgi:tellurite resistance protein TehA-like permease